MGGAKQGRFGIFAFFPQFERGLGAQKWTKLGQNRVDLAHFSLLGALLCLLAFGDTLSKC